MTGSANLKSRVIADFENLQSIQLETKEQQLDALSKAQALLRSVFAAAVGKVEYSIQDRETIGSLIPCALMGISAFISQTNTYFPPHGSLGWSKVERSGLQFLIDQFRHVDALATKAFQDFESAEDIEGWNDHLMGAAFFVSFNIHELDLPAEQLRNVPQHHHWLSVPFV